MYKVKLYNNIAQIGLDQFTEEFDVSDAIENEDAIVVRSANLHEIKYPKTLKCIARAGAGVNNIDIQTCTDLGIAVFNTPGANSNAVKELVIAGLLLASRDIYGGISWARSQAGNANLSKDMEKQKKYYAGNEIGGKSLGVIGCGAIGIQVANLALNFNMDVFGYDPFMSIDAAWQLSKNVHHEKEIDGLYRESDFITIHVPQNDATKGMLNKDAFAKMKNGVKILNFARGGLVNDEDMLEALNSGKVACYVTDFPSPILADHPHVIPMPHLGASTAESEENCAVKAAQETMEYLKYGNIINSVNLPNNASPMTTPFRVCVLHKNVPKMIAKITDCVAQDNANIETLSNKSKGEIAYTMLDMDQEASEQTIEMMRKIYGVVRVETYKA